MTVHGAAEVDGVAFAYARPVYRFLPFACHCEQREAIS